jgi:N-acetylmuramoyl-L-alanine amidase
MRWINSIWISSKTSSQRARAAGLPILILMLMFLASALLLSGAPDEKRISIYSTVANYSLQVLERDGNDYVGLLEILEPLGQVSARTEGQHWKLRYNDVDAEFTNEKKRARLHREDFDLPAGFRLENSRGLVPLSSLSTLLPRILGGPVSYHDLSRRLFIGSVAVHFTAQVIKANPPKLVMNFSAPVNPMIATEAGRLRMVFTREPVLPPSSLNLTFDSKTILSANYGEINGAAEIAVNSTVPLLASFSNNGRTITLEPVGIPATQPQAAQVPSGPPPSIPASVALPNPAVPAPRRYFAVVDAAHGGEDRGAALSDQLAEKDVTLTFARHLRQELEAHGLTTLLLRDSDTTLSLDQRASTTNSVHPAIYICIHATSEGNSLRLYTSLLPPDSENRRLFLDWDSAQAASRTLSQTAQTNLSAELQHAQFAIHAYIAPLRPLNNITTAAVAVELTPPENGVAQLNSSSYQQAVSSALASGIASLRTQLEAAP